MRQENRHRLPQDSSMPQACSHAGSEPLNQWKRHLPPFDFCVACVARNRDSGNTCGRVSIAWADNCALTPLTASTTIAALWIFDRCRNCHVLDCFYFFFLCCPHVRLWPHRLPSGRQRRAANCQQHHKLSPPSPLQQRKPNQIRRQHQHRHQQLLPRPRYPAQLQYQP